MSVLTKDEFNRLGSKEFHGYLPAPFGDKRDEFMERIIDRVHDREDFDQTAAQLSGKSGAFDAYAARAASLAIRNNDQSMVRRGLVSVAFALGGTGSKEVLMQVPLPLRSAQLLGMDIDALLDWLSNVVSEADLNYIRGYAEPARLADYVKDMGYEETGKGPNFKYVFAAW